MIVENSDWLLVQRVQQGDNRAFDLLVLKYQNKLGSVVSRYIRDHDEIKDVVQDAFIKAYKALHNFRGESAFYTWVYRIAINTAKNYLMAKSRKVPQWDVAVEDAHSYDGSERLADSLTPENALATKQLEDQLYKAIAALPDDLKTALTLREFDGLSYEEIATAMDTPIGTVRSRIFRARASVDQEIHHLSSKSA